MRWHSPRARLGTVEPGGTGMEATSDVAGSGPRPSVPGGTGALGDLDPEKRREEQARTLASPKRRHSKAARALFRGMDLVYGRKRSLRKFLVLELIARVPYQSWEQVAYIAITHVARRPGMARRIYDRVAEARAQQDNEQWHLLILEDLLQRERARMGLLRYQLLPQVIAFAYYQFSCCSTSSVPTGATASTPTSRTTPSTSTPSSWPSTRSWRTRRSRAPSQEEYGSFESLADMFRQVGYDERVHKEESIALMASPRFR